MTNQIASILLPVFVHPHLMILEMPGRFPGKTGQTLDQPGVERGPVAHDRYPCVQMKRLNTCMSLCKRVSDASCVHGMQLLQ